MTAFEKLPKVFAPVYSHVMPRIIQVYNGAMRPKITEISLQLINTMMLDATAALAKDDGKALNEISFTGINRAGSFKSMDENVKNQCMVLAVDYIKMLIGDANVDLPGMKHNN